MYSSAAKKMDWSTPQDLFDRLNEEFHFTLDPCADDFNHKCDRYYTEEQDGLQQDWSGERVFCNPPYGKDVPKWVKKCHDETRFRGCELVVMLIPARTDTRWFHDYIYHKADEVRFVKGRIRFGGQTTNAPFPSMVVVFRRGAE
jgi:site-specific DNA-methyltransferase (adenine-specific)